MQLPRGRRIYELNCNVRVENEYGLDLIPRFRAMTPAPIVILTGHGSEEVAVRAFRAKAVDYLKKPFDIHALQATVASAIQSPPDPPEPLDAFVRVHRHLAEDLASPHTVPSIAAAVELSERHLRRIVQAASGYTPQRYLIRLRLRRAVNLLEQSARTIKQVAAAAGFKDLKAFSRAFTRIYGVSPSSYRRRQHPLR